ncbi:hypothetical protein KC614_01915 [candidate division WWE3 bacterium]|uniref:Uncharacterized protein n=1 Tax=candidate division WWE3 bacterium TaxID=2053526 RepID=A0A955LK36_UNCKA|nr:hypothetical protein [candidate division WWE3 bacterium]
MDHNQYQAVVTKLTGQFLGIRGIQDLPAIAITSWQYRNYDMGDLPETHQQFFSHALLSLADVPDNKQVIAAAILAALRQAKILTVVDGAE